jgi:heme/copper-type cytochrome/quinol oxidase subunit 1
MFIASSKFEFGVGAGWTFYPPLSSYPGHSGPAVDALIYSLHMAGLSSILGAMNFIVTTANMRCRGMYMHRLPLFV